MSRALEMLLSILDIEKLEENCFGALVRRPAGSAYSAAR